MLTPPKVEVYAHTDEGFARLGILWILVKDSIYVLHWQICKRQGFLNQANINKTYIEYILNLQEYKVTIRKT